MAARGTRCAGLAAMLLAAAILTGCAHTPDLSTATASSLQASVRLVAERAASRHYSAALASLDSLQSQLDGDIAAGLVGHARGARVQAAIDLVRKDLGSRATPSPTPTPPPVPTPPTPPTKEKGDGKDKPHGKHG